MPQEETQQTDVRGDHTGSERLILDVEFRKHCWSQVNQATLDTAAKTINSLFLINGAAATALFAQPGMGLKSAAILFAVGALFAIVAFGFSYWFLLLQGAYFADRPADDVNRRYIATGLPAKSRFALISKARLQKSRLVAVAAAVLSAMLFLSGVICVGRHWQV